MLINTLRLVSSQRQSNTQGRLVASFITKVETGIQPSFYSYLNSKLMCEVTNLPDLLVMLQETSLADFSRQFYTILNGLLVRW